MATPWKAIADYAYTHSKLWRSTAELAGDLRIEISSLLARSKEELQQISQFYPSLRVRRMLEHFFKELKEYLA